MAAQQIVSMANIVLIGPTIVAPRIVLEIAAERKCANRGDTGADHFPATWPAFSPSMIADTTFLSDLDRWLCPLLS